jgi:hypothetical protein
MRDDAASVAAKCEVQLGWHFTLPQIRAGVPRKYKCEVELGPHFTLPKYGRGVSANTSVKWPGLYIPLDPIQDLRSGSKYRASHFTLSAFFSNCEVGTRHFTLPLHTSPDTGQPPLADTTVKSNTPPLHTFGRSRQARKCEVVRPSPLHTSHFRG